MARSKKSTAVASPVQVQSEEIAKPEPFSVQHLNRDGFPTMSSFKGTPVARINAGGERFKIFNELMGSKENPGVAKHQVYLVTGGGNAGKTTFLVTYAGHCAADNILFVIFKSDTDESQINDLKRRLKLPNENFIIDSIYDSDPDETMEQSMNKKKFIKTENGEIKIIQKKIEKIRLQYPDAEMVVGVDSLQSVSDDSRSSALSFVKDCVLICEMAHITMFILGEDTKGGTFLGHQSLTNKANHLQFKVTGDNSRSIHSMKNRFGKTGVIYSHFLEDGHHFLEEKPAGAEKKKSKVLESASADELAAAAALLNDM